MQECAPLRWTLRLPLFQIEKLLSIIESRHHSWGRSQHSYLTPATNCLPGTLLVLAINTHCILSTIPARRDYPLLQAFTNLLRMIITLMRKCQNKPDVPRTVFVIGCVLGLQYLYCSTKRHAFFSSKLQWFSEWHLPRTSAESNSISGFLHYY